jgi:hypothetical protein
MITASRSGPGRDRTRYALFRLQLQTLHSGDKTAVAKGVNCDGKPRVDAVTLDTDVATAGQVQRCCEFRAQPRTTSRRLRAQTRTLADLIAFSGIHYALEMPYWPGSLLDGGNVLIIERSPPSRRERVLPRSGMTTLSTRCRDRCPPLTRPDRGSGLSNLSIPVGIRDSADRRNAYAARSCIDRS